MTKQVKTSKSESVKVDAKAAVEAAVEEVKKSVKRSKDAPVAAAPAEAAAVAAPPKEKKKKAAAPAEAAAVVEEKAAVDEEPVERKRRVVTRDDVEKSFDDLIKQLEEEIESVRQNDDKNKSKGVRFIRGVLKQVRQLRSDSLRVASKKNRRQGASSNSGNSGFMKPVKISSDMQKFTGLKEDQLVSRVDVTKSICNYVKEHNLQNQSNRREFTPDQKLAKLLGTTAPVTYYALQQHIQPHFIKDKQ
jgi:chromatin remodeling complex protein RSC6